MISEEEAARFERDGFLVIDDPCPIELVGAVREEIEPALHDESHPGQERADDGVVFVRYPSASGDFPYYWRRVKNAWVFSEPIRKLALHPRILSIADELVGKGRKVMPFQTLNFPVGTEQPVHYDSMAFESDPRGYMCGVWVALEDVDMDNGPLVYYPGSHKLPSLSQQEIEDVLGEPLVRRESYSEYQQFVTGRSNQYTAYCERLIEIEGLEPAYGTIKKGQALLWHANLFHGGAPQRDRTRTRHSQVTHYFFEGCKAFYTPFRTEDEHIFWDYGFWIRDPVPDYSTELLHGVIRENVLSGKRVLVATRGEEDLIDLDGVAAAHFPGGENGFGAPELKESDLVDRLEEQRRAGANYIVFPRRELRPLQNRFPRLQEHLETNYPSIVRDAFICAIYSLGHGTQ